MINKHKNTCELQINELKNNSAISDEFKAELDDIVSSLYLYQLMTIQEPLENIYNGINIEPSIDQLKRQIKHCKNPMELKQLNRQLNEAYKDKKRKKAEV